MFKSIRSLSILNLKRAYTTCLPTCPCDPGTNITVLPNGIRIATEYRPTPVSCMSLFVEAGPRFETSHNNGISHLLEHLAYKGFVGYTQSGLENSLWQMGAKMTANTSRELQSFTGIFLSENAKFIFDNLAAVYTNLNLNNFEIEKEKYNICLEMVDEDEDPRSVTFDYLHETAFQGTPLARRVIGPTKNVSRFDACTVRDFYCQHYQPYKLCFCTTGNVNHNDIVCWASARLGHIFGDPNCESNDGPARFTGSQIIYRNDSMPFAHVAIAFEAPGYTSPHYYKYLVASRFMGKWHKSQGGKLGNASYLARATSCDDTCDSFESFYITYRDVGLWGVYFVTKRLDVEDMVEYLQRQWMSLCVTLQHSDVERAINTVKLELAQEMAGMVSSCADIGTQMMYTCTRQSLQDKFDSLEAIQLRMVLEISEEMLYDKCPAVAAVGPTEGLPDYLRIRSGQYWLRI